ncbi:DUF4193 family protein [Rhodococcus koreensis]
MARNTGTVSSIQPPIFGRHALGTEGHRGLAPHPIPTGIRSRPPPTTPPRPPTRHDDRHPPNNSPPTGNNTQSPTVNREDTDNTDNTEPLEPPATDPPTEDLTTHTPQQPDEFTRTSTTLHHHNRLANPTQPTCRDCT